MKKFLSVIFVLAMSFSLCAPVFAVEGEHNVTYIDEETRRADIERQAKEYIAFLEAHDRQARGEYDYTYTSEYGERDTATRSEYPSQPSGGMKFDKPGGYISWNPEGGPTVSASVSFSPPFLKKYGISLCFGYALKGSGVGYGQAVDNYTDHVKLYVTRTDEVVPVAVYRTHRYTGVTELYSTSYMQTLYSFEFRVDIV